MPVNFPAGLGWIFALLVLCACLILWIVGRAITDNEILALFALLALARLVP